MDSSIVAVVSGLVVGLLCLVVLRTLDRSLRFIEEIAGVDEVAVFERAKRMLAGFDRVLVVLVRAVLHVVGTVGVVGHVISP